MRQEEHWGYTIQEWQSEPFRRLLEQAFTQKPRVIYDVGACVGGWSFVVKKLFGVDTFAFEPFKENFVYMSNKLSSPCFDFGIYYGKTQAKAMWRGSNIGAIFVDDVDSTMAIDTHQHFTLKTFEELELPKPDLIKLDVEGAELNIIENSTLLQTTPQLLIEWHYRETIDGASYFSNKLPHTVIDNLENNMFLLRL